MNINKLRSHPFLGLLRRSEARRLLAEADMAEYPKGSIVFSKGDSCEAFYIILVGRCETSRGAPGERLRDVAVCGRNDILGEREVLHHHLEYRKSARALTDSVLLRIEAEPFRNLLRRRPRLAGVFNLHLEEKLHRLHQAEPFGHVGRVVSLLSLEASLPLQNSAELLADNLHQETGQEVLLLVLTPDSQWMPLSKWRSVESRLNGGFPFAEHLEPVGDGFHRLHLSISGDPMEHDCLAPLLSHAALPTVLY